MNNNEIREYRQDLQNRVMRIETILERVESHLDNLNNRTGKLEGWRNWMVGAMAAMGLVIGIIKIGVV